MYCANFNPINLKILLPSTRSIGQDHLDRAWSMILLNGDMADKKLPIYFLNLNQYLKKRMALLFIKNR